MPLSDLVVEDGTGLVNSNSYVSYAEARDYMFRVPDAYKSAWNALAEFEISQLLIWSTALLDDWIYFVDVTRLHPVQALNFPLLGLVDQFGYYVEHFPLPEFIKRATCQMAFELSKSDRVVEPTRGLESASVGPLSVVFDKNQAHSPKVIPRSVAAIVMPWGGHVRGSSGNRSVRTYRA